MSRKLFFLIGLLLGSVHAPPAPLSPRIPILKSYDAEHLLQIALPLGGIGAGTVSLGGRGELRDWEIMNVPGKGYSTVTDGNDAPFPYWSEAMTGFEYTAAIGMLNEGMEAEGLEIIRNIRARYDGAKRNPFDEAECGHHYARAMASWAGVLAQSGFQYSAVTQSMRFTGRPGTYFWSTGSAWGTCTIEESGDAELKVLFGELVLRNLQIGERGRRWSHGPAIVPGQPLKVRW